MKFEEYINEGKKFTGVKFNDATNNYELWIDGKLAETVSKKVYDTDNSKVHTKWLKSYKTLQTLEYFKKKG